MEYILHVFTLHGKIMFTLREIQNTRTLQEHNARLNREVPIYT